jgi:hypothetical protein
MRKHLVAGVLVEGPVFLMACSSGTASSPSANQAVASTTTQPPVTTTRPPPATIPLTTTTRGPVGLGMFLSIAKDFINEEGASP